MPETIIEAGRIGRRHPNVVALWDALIAAESTARQMPGRAAPRRYVAGLLDAYALITGDDEESVWEDLTEALIARTESRG